MLAVILYTLDQSAMDPYWWTNKTKYHQTWNSLLATPSGKVPDKCAGTPLGGAMLGGLAIHYSL